MPQEIVFGFVCFFPFFNIPKETFIFSFIQLEEKTQLRLLVKHNYNYSVFLVCIKQEKGYWGIIKADFNIGETFRLILLEFHFPHANISTNFKKNIQVSPDTLILGLNAFPLKCTSAQLAQRHLSNSVWVESKAHKPAL